MTKILSPFDDDTFIDRFLDRRSENDSVNATIDEPAILERVALLKPRRTLELGCAAGGLTGALVTHCSEVLAVDGSESLVRRAVDAVGSANVRFVCARFENLAFGEEFDCVVSGLALHLVEDFDGLVSKVFLWLQRNGHFIFSVRHPIRTAYPTGACSVGGQSGWTVVGYNDSGPRNYSWLGEDVTYYHRSIGHIFQALTKSGFVVLDVCEPLPVGTRQTQRVLENESVPAVLLFHCFKPE